MQSHRGRNLDLLVSFVWPALTLSQQRIAAANRLLEWLIVLGVTITLTVLSIAARSDQARPLSPLLLALIFLIVATVLGFLSRRITAMLVLDLTPLSESLLMVEYHFKHEIVTTTGECIAENNRIVTRKYHHAVVMGGLYLGEATMLTLWLIGCDPLRFIASAWEAVS